MYLYYYYLGASETSLNVVSIPESRRGLKGAHYFKNKTNKKQLYCTSLSLAENLGRLAWIG